MRGPPLLLFAGLFPACGEVIVLGTDCPEHMGLCATEVRGPRDAMADTRFDGGDANGNPGGPDTGADAAGLDGGIGADGGAQDAATPLDGGSTNDAAPASLFPAFQNPSFELVGGRATGELFPTDSNSAIAPWYACRTGIEVVANADSAQGTVAPRDGDTFLGDSFPNTAVNITGLYQDLNPGLVAGMRYAFVVDVYSDSNGGNDLQLQLASGARACLPPSPVLAIASSRPVRDGAWQRECFAFTAPRDIGTVVLMASAPSGFLNFGSRLYVDNLRSEPDCQ